MKLTILEAEWVRYSEADGRILLHKVPTFDEAQGIKFLCPKCFGLNKGPVGTHSVLFWFSGRGVPDDAEPKSGRRIPYGTSFDDLTFVGPGAVSVAVDSGCRWHGFVENGNAQ